MATNEVESMEDIQKRLDANIERQRKATADMRTGGIYASFKNARLKIDGQDIPNNKADIRVLAAIGERAYYPGPFDADKSQVPTCYALDSGAPHDEAREAQAESCVDCAHNKWGTAVDSRGNPARGKACREGARVIFISANLPVKSAPMITAKIPVTSLKTVTNLTERCSSAGKLTGEFVTELEVTEDKKSFFKVLMTLKNVTADINKLELLNAQERAYQLAMQPYPQLED
jgi:hypothetical protein